MLSSQKEIDLELSTGLRVRNQKPPSLRPQAKLWKQQTIRTESSKTLSTLKKFDKKYFKKSETKGSETDEAEKEFLLLDSSRENDLLLINNKGERAETDQENNSIQVDKNEIKSPSPISLQNESSDKQNLRDKKMTDSSVILFDNKNVSIKSESISEIIEEISIVEEIVSESVSKSNKKVLFKESPIPGPKPEIEKISPKQDYSDDFEEDDDEAVKQISKEIQIESQISTSIKILKKSENEVIKEKEREISERSELPKSNISLHSAISENIITIHDLLEDSEMNQRILSRSEQIPIQDILFENQSKKSVSLIYTNEENLLSKNQESSKKEKVESKYSDDFEKSDSTTIDENLDESKMESKSEKKEVKSISLSKSHRKELQKSNKKIKENKIIESISIKSEDGERIVIVQRSAGVQCNLKNPSSAVRNRSTQPRERKRNKQHHRKQTSGRMSVQINATPERTTTTQLFRSPFWERELIKPTFPLPGELFRFFLINNLGDGIADQHVADWGLRNSVESVKNAMRISYRNYLEVFNS